MKLILRSIIMIALPVLGSAGKAAVAQGYPAKPVRIVEPFGMGGGPDLLARALAPKLSELWGQPVTVENVPGAGATAGPARVAKSPADGYTLLLNTSAQAYGATLENLPYDPLKDFIAVAALTSQPYVLVAGKASGVMSVRALIAAAKARPGELKFGSTGAGTGTHLGIVTFNRDAGIRAVDVPPQPTDAIADVLAATISGRITYMIAPISITLQPIHDGTLVPLGVTTVRRSSLLPKVPTIDQAGVKGFNFPIWYGIWVPVGTPVEVVDKLAKDIARVLARPEVRDWVAEHGGEVMSMSRADFAGLVQSESERAARLGTAARSTPRR
jgi:tripartite-type tricarboxylate transporter receptor subunit TctC